MVLVRETKRIWAFSSLEIFSSAFNIVQGHSRGRGHDYGRGGIFSSNKKNLEKLVLQDSKEKHLISA